MMKAFYLSDLSKLDTDLAACKTFFPEGIAEHVRIFTASSVFAAFPYCATEVGSLFFPGLQGVFDQAVVGQSLRIFKNPWGEAMLAHIHIGLKPNGSILIPFLSDKAAKQKGYFTLAALQKLFQQKGTVTKTGGLLKREGWVEFTKKEAVAPKASTLTWYFQNYAELILQNLTNESRSVDLTSQSAQALRAPMQLSSNNRAVQVPTGTVAKEALKDAFSELDTAPTNLPEQLQIQVGSQAYSVSGISYKSALLTHIIQQNFKAKQPLKYIDQGGGYGLLAAELLLNPELNLVKGVNCDIGQHNEKMAFQLFSALRPQLENRFFFDLGAAQDFTYDDSYDVISYIGSLLYVPKEKTLYVLQEAWNALNPGGILVVHENIKTPAYVRDFDFMFEVDQLDELLSNFGSVQRYLSTVTIPVTKEQAGQKTVFRVLKKSS